MGRTLWDRSITTEAGIHHTFTETIEDTVEGRGYRFSMEGDFDDLLDIRSSIVEGERVDNSITDKMLNKGTKANSQDCIISGLQLSRKEGNVGVLDVMMKSYPRGYVGVVDFDVVPTNIHQWRKKAKDNVPDFNVIRLWEDQKAYGKRQNDAYYGKLQYEDASGNLQSIRKQVNEGKLSQATLLLARMILNGVESFNVYVPTLQLTWVLPLYPTTIDPSYVAGGLLGRICEPGDLCLKGDGYGSPKGPSFQNYSDPVSDFVQKCVGNYIICTGDNVTGNSDGSYTVVRSFTKAFNVEEQLFLNSKGNPIASPGPWYPKWGEKPSKENPEEKEDENDK